MVMSVADTRHSLPFCLNESCIFLCVDDMTIFVIKLSFYDTFELLLH